MRLASRIEAITVVAALASTASAQPSQNATAAEAQFEKGRSLEKAGNWRDACLAFEQSQKLDPQFGTLYNVGECDQHIGKLASAWAAYRELAQRDTNIGRRDHARELARQLEPRLSKLRVSIVPPIDHVALTMNGNDVSSLVGIESPVDTGTYELVASAPGYDAAHATAAVSDEGKTVSIEMTLAKSAEPAPTIAAPTATPAPVVAAQTAPIDHRTRRPYAISAVSLGGGLVIGGLVFGALADVKWRDATKLCPNQICATAMDTANATADANATRTRGTIADVLIAAGVVSAGVGVYLFLTEPRHAETATALRLVVGPGALTLAGGF